MTTAEPFEERFLHIKPSPVPNELKVKLSNGVAGIVAIPPGADHDDFLERLLAPPTTKMALLLHGQGGHKDYCYQRMLAHKLASDLGMYSLRIDFRGCGDSAEVADAKVGRVLELDIEDIEAAVEFVTDSSKNPLHQKFSLTSIIGHSRGSLAMFLWAVKQERLLKDPKTASEAVVVPNLVNCSLRFRSETVLDRYPVLQDDFEFVEQTAYRYGKYRQLRVTRSELSSLLVADTPLVMELSPQWSVLSIYGTEDTIVPKEDGALYANALNRGPLTHRLELIDGADHNFYGVEEISNESDAEDFNPYDLPLSRSKKVNYNYVATALITKFLSPEQELQRFNAITKNVGLIPRAKVVDGIANFRDLGGWEVYKPTFNVDGPCRVRSGYIFRCANTANVSKDGLKAMQQLRIKAMFDLRSEEECTKNGFPTELDAFGVARYHTPVFRHEDYSPDAIALRLLHLLTSWHTYVHVYDQMLENGVDAFRSMFEFIRDHPNDPLVLHCTAGKDRTGVFCMLVLKLAGVDLYTIAKEYELTTYGLIPDREKIRQSFVKGLQQIREKGGASQVEALILRGRKNWSLEKDGFDNLISSRAEAMLSTIDHLEDKFGGIVGYMQNQLGFSEADIETIFRHIVCPPAHPAPQSKF